MQQQIENHLFTGMLKDLSVSKHPSSFLCDALNVRITARDNDTLLSITNERGPKDLNIKVTGTYLGHCILNNYIIVFSTDSTRNNPDIITKITLPKQETDDIITEVLYEGKLNFNINNKIETLGSFENEDIQKVYWTDGLNQPRVINIRKSKDDYTNIATPFDFIQEIKLEETIDVLPLYGSGEFPTGVIQYAFTYYNNHMLETNVFNVTKLYSVAFKDRGGSPEEKVSMSFKITINNPDTSFDYIRIYSIQRTSVNAVPITKIVLDILLPKGGDSTNTATPTPTSITFLDTGFVGSDINPTELLYKGGNAITAGTITTKDGTLFLGNITLDKNQTTDYKLSSVINTEYKEFSVDTLNSGDFNYCRNIDANGFKFNEYYRFGILFQSKTGEWSLPYVLYTTDGDDDGDTRKYTYQITKYPTISINELNTTALYLPHIKATVDISSINDLDSYKRARLIMALPEYSDRTIISQGICCPTIYTNHDRFGAKVDTQTLSTNSGDGGDSSTSGTSGNDEGDSGNTDNPRTPQLKFNTGEHSLELARPSLDGELINPWAGPSSEGGDGEGGDGNNNGGGTTGGDSGGSTTPTTSAINGPLFAQSSWIFRPYGEPTSVKSINGQAFIKYKDKLSYYTSMNNANDFRDIEVGANLGPEKSHLIDKYFMTIHTPDIIFDHALYNNDWSLCSLYKLGSVNYINTYSDIDIQTSTPTIGDAPGFIHRTFKGEDNVALISGLFYEDYVVDDLNDTPSYGRWKDSREPVAWPVFMWHKSASLNNDVNRAGRSALLLKKKISNYHVCTTILNSNEDPLDETIPVSLINTKDIKLFSSDLLSLIKVNGHTYMGNVDTLLSPISAEPKFFAGDHRRLNSALINHDTTNCLYKFDTIEDGDNKQKGKAYLHTSSGWNPNDTFVIGDHVPALCVTSEGVRMKYKSTPHLVADCHSYTDSEELTDFNGLYLVDIHSGIDPDSLYGGISEDGFKSNLWIPISNPYIIEDIKETTGTEGSETTTITLQSDRGDTYFQQYECLKTYAFTPEDTNQVIEIASFYVESHINLDGRYDKNRNQVSNLNMSPLIFNLHNPIYNLLDNFFNYRILDEDFYTLNSFPNQVTWTKEKHPGAEIDNWTNITLASTYSMDGSKGEIRSLNVWKDFIYCFLDKGVSNILFNSRVLIPASDGVPIEISNSYKVEGHRYLSDGVGCSNKYNIKETPTGIYFVDSVTNNLHLISEGVNDVATSHNMSTWYKNNKVLKLVYDNVNHDLYSVTEDEALCYSEILLQYSSRMSYGNTEFLESFGNNIYAMNNSNLYLFNKGDYNKYYNNTFNPWYITFVSNGLDNKENKAGMDKVFENIEYRMDRYSWDSTNNAFINEHDKSLDFIRVYNEYQDSEEQNLITKQGIPSNLKKKFRVWRANIPRHLNRIYYTLEQRQLMLIDKLKTDPNITIDDIPEYREQRKDRIRNTWCNIQVGIKNNNTDKIVLHDMNVYYYI